MLSENYVYHLVTNRKMEIGQIIDFTSSERNTLYTFFFEKECTNAHGETVETILARNFTEAGMTLDSEDAQIVMGYYNHTIRSIRETIVEMVRLSEFPEYPSRLSCLYAAETYEEALEWKKIFDGFNRKVLQIVKLKASGGYFKGDAMCLPNEKGISFSKKIEEARKYWMGEKGSALQEVLIDGQIEVVEIIKDYTF